MNFRKLKKLALLALFLYLPVQSMAWGMLGHRIVGQVAESYLKAKTRKEIAKILGSESLAMASNWADLIKSDPAYNYLSAWHYIDFKKDATDNDIRNYLKQDTNTDVYTKINFLVSGLKKKSLPQNTKVMYLRLLVHLVGDVHQPMHCGYEEDKGGNDVKVTWFNKRMNLHSLWDSGLIEYQQLSYTEYANAINHPSAKQIKIWQGDNLSRWIIESHDLSKKLYKEAETHNKLSFRYNFDHIDELNQRLLAGGVRLAGLLNEIFKS